VLKQAESPSVLIELGYLSNPTEAKQMVSPAWQAHVSRAIAGAVDAYFARIAGK
jgi:N-acetylmuramoyl-L-alanine amidase